MDFVDSRSIRVKSGCGGPGMVSFRSAHNRPKLGADGGDGGFGGHVYFRGDCRLNTLSRLYPAKLYAGQDGHKGGSNGKTGADGEDCIIDVPLGTMALDRATGRVLCEVLEHQQKYLVAQGGKRGLGNLRYISSTHQAPVEYSAGSPGQEYVLDLELKLIADVGFCGLPNAGKSTLLSCISNARPKIASYPFTTLIPQLGIVEMGPLADLYGSSFVAADIPGLIGGASQGKGLGHDFLRHIERTKIIAYVIAAVDDSETPMKAFHKLRTELQGYSPALAEKPGVVILSKQDLIADEEVEADVLDLKEHIEALGWPWLSIAAVQNQGLDQLKRTLFEIIHRDLPVLLDAQEPRAMADDHQRWRRSDQYQFVVTSEMNKKYGLSVL